MIANNDNIEVTDNNQNSQCSCEGPKVDDHFGLTSGNVKRLQATVEDTIISTNDIIDSESDDWMDEVIDVFTQVKLPIPFSKPKSPYFLQPIHCAKCGNVYKNKCYHCVVNVKEKSKTAMKKGCQDIVKKQYRPTYVKLGFQETVNSLRKKMAKILNQQRLKGNNVDVYWRVGTKQSNDLNWIAKQVVNGELAVAFYRLHGGMMNDKEDIQEIPNIQEINTEDLEEGFEDPIYSIDLSESYDEALEEAINAGPWKPPKSPLPREVDPEDEFSELRCTLPKKVINRNKGKQAYQQPPNTLINGLKVEGSRNREKVPDMKEGVKSHMKAMYRNNCNRAQREHNEESQSKMEPNASANGDYYVATIPMYEGDPSYRCTKLGTLFEDQMEYARFSLRLNQNPVNIINPFLGQLAVPKPIPGHTNILTEWSAKIQYIWLPEPTEYNQKFDYSCRVGEETLVYSFPSMGSYRSVAYPNCLMPTGRTYLIFHEYQYDLNSLLFEPKSMLVKTYGRDMLVPDYILTYARNWMGGKNLTNFTIVSYMNEFTKWWNSSANKEFTEPTRGQILGGLFQAGREKHVNLFEQLGLNFDILNLQHDNTKLLVDLPKHGNLWSILKKIVTWIVPQELLDVAKEIIDSYKFTGMGLNIWGQLKDAFNSGVVFLFGRFLSNTPLMKAFAWMDDKAAVILEEILKLVPGLGLIIAVKEIIDDYKKGTCTVTSALTRLLFHNWDLILPFWWRVATLPIRMAWHWAWNRKTQKDSKYETLHKIVYNKLEIPISEFSVVNNDPTFPRFPKSEPVEVPKKMKDQLWIYKMLTDCTEELRNPVYTPCTVASSNCAGVKNGNNLVSAYLKRNIQDRPLKKLDGYTVVHLHALAMFWKEMLQMEEVDTVDWINQKNHGPKKKMYMEAFKEFQRTGDIDYRATLQLKYDEVLMKEMMRTICAFHNSYVVNVAPTIASCSNALKKLFNGYNNLSRRPEYTLHILYATGMLSSEIAKVIEDNMYLESTTVHHYFLMVLGDDSALMRNSQVLCCDFSRYDSTQHASQHEAFRRMFTTAWNEDKIEMLRKAADAPTKLFDPNSGEKYIVPTVGLKTGCMETSVSNTTITALAYAAGLESAYIIKTNPFESIPIFLKDGCGFLPKASYQHLHTGAEFLKTIFILEKGKIVSLPILSCLAKLGKFLTEPRLIVPFAKIKNNHQISVDAVFMQLKGKGNLENVPGYSLWYNSLRKLAQPFLPTLKTPFQVELNNPKISKETIAAAYESRYGLDWEQVESLFIQLSELGLEDYPVTYTSTVVQRAIEVDYGLDPPF
jgi:hypothetical protein